MPASLAETFQDLHFPKAGLHTAAAFGRQPTRKLADGTYARTTALGANVRAFDASAGRERGGSRPGVVKFISTQVNGTFITQHLSVLVSTGQLGATLQTSQSGRVVSLLAVSQGVVKVANPGSTAWTAVTNNTGETPALNATGVMQSAQNNQKMYFVDGVNYVYYAPLTNSLELWAATAGTLPEDTDGNYARLICTWRGRTVLSGLLLDPQNWFMSAVSDPNDFDYAPQFATATQAVAGNNADLGLIGDVVTALIPYTDDVLVVGCDHSIQMMRGDPNAGGQIDLVSDAVGMAFGAAWCKDPYGNVYFFSNSCGIYQFVPGRQVPLRISQPIEPLVQAVNTGTNIIRMIWNDRQQGLHVFVSPSGGPAATTHYFWEMRTNAWWTDTFANTNHDPVTCVAFDGNQPDDRHILIGSWDGYVRELDPTATADDGSNIASAVLIGPILTAELDEMLLKDIQAVMSEASGTVSYEILAADTPELAVASTARVTGSFIAGRNPTHPIRCADHAIYIKITATTRWAMESIRARFAGRGKVRRRKP